MDINIQIQSIKSQIMNINSGIDNISLQNNNMFMANNIQKGEQLLNLSIQILNTGIQAFNIGKNIIGNYNKYYAQLQLISQQINLLINENNLIQQQMMQQMIPQQMINLFPSGMNQSNWIEQYQNPIQNIIVNNEKINVVFVKANSCQKNILGEFDETLEHLFNKYIDRIKAEIDINKIDNIRFLIPYNGSTEIVHRKDKRKVGQVFGKPHHLTIHVSGDYTL